MSSQASPSSHSFIIHAEADAWFVKGVLLEALGLPAGRVKLAGELPLGRALLVELERCVRASRLTLVVVSHAFVSDEWSKHTEVLASHAALGGERVVVPLRLDDCEVPLHLAALTSLDLRRRERWPDELDKLRRQLPDLLGAASHPAAAPAALPCPYPGMRPFRGDEDKRFFGREREIESILAHLRVGERLLFALGPSGSGKSSLIAAGVLPLLRDEAARLRYGLPHLTARTMRPGERPAERLAELVGATSTAPAAVLAAVRASSAPGGELLLFIDQLEELFTVASAAARDLFLAQLVALRQDRRCRLLFAARADFFGALIDGPLWVDGKTLHVAVAPLRGEALRQAISAPARDLGVTFEPGLIERLVADAEGEPGVLPLLQETLVRLWARKQWRVLSLASYEELGRGGRHGLAVAIAMHADACLRQLDDEAERCARRILLRLVAFGEGTADTRRQQLRGALAEGAEPRAFAATLEALAHSRLITLDGDADRRGDAEARVDLAHEALLWAWPTLAQWVALRRKEEEQRRRLVLKVAEWKERRAEDATAGLLDVLELREAESWLGSESARDLGEVSGLAELVRESRAQRTQIQRQRDEARRLLGAMYFESGRQLLLDDHPQRAIPYLVAAREELGDIAALQMLFHSATRAVVKVTLGHRAEVSAVALCPKSGRVATASVDGTARVWDAASGEPLTPVLVHDGPIQQVSFSQDGRLLVIACSDHTARLWDAASGRPLAPVVRHDNAVWVAELSRDGSRLLTASLDRSARVWDVRSGQPITPPLLHDDWVVDAAFSADERRVVTASHDGSARIWDAQSGALVADLPHGSSVEHAAFSPDGTKVVTAGGKAARLWDAAGGGELAMLRHGAPVVMARFSPDGTKIATASSDRTARVWDAASGEPCTPPLVHAASVEHVAFSASGRLLVSSSSDRTARLWDVARGKAVAAPLEHGQAVAAAELSLDERTVITCSADRTARAWEISQPSGLPCFDHGRSVRSAAFSPDGQQVVTVSRGQHALVWDIASGAALLRLKHDRPVRSAVFSPDGARLATASWDQTARLWDAATGAPCSPRLSHRGGVEQVAFRADGQLLVTAATDRLARLWRVDSGELVRSLGPHPGPVRDASFSPDGAQVLTACDDGVARLWDAASGELRGAWISHGKPLASAAFSPDGAQVVTASADGTARVWDVATRRPAPHVMEHGGAVYRAAFSPDGQRVVTASADKTAQVWDASSARMLAPPMVHGDRVLSAAFSTDGQRVITASHDRTAQLWDVALDGRSLEEWRAIAERCEYLLSAEPPPAIMGEMSGMVGTAIGAVVAAEETARVHRERGEAPGERAPLDELRGRVGGWRRGGRAAPLGELGELGGLAVAHSVDRDLLVAEVECEHCGQPLGPAAADQEPAAARAAKPARSSPLTEALAFAVEELARCVDARAGYDSAAEAAAAAEAADDPSFGRWP